MTSIPEEKKAKAAVPNTTLSLIVVGVLAAIFIYASVVFLGMRKFEAVPKGPGVTRTGLLSDYFPALKGSAGDTEIFYLEGTEPGKTVICLGGVHPNEPSGVLAATLLVENAQVQTGRLIVVPHTNASAFTYSTPGEGTPISYTIKTDWGEQKYRYGSRLSNPLHQFPDPDVFVHYPSGQLMSGNEARNLDRAFPGNPNGGLTQKVAYAVTEMVKKENAGLVIDMHEARLMNPIVNCIITPERALTLSSLAQMELEFSTKEPWHLEPSPTKMFGMTHRGLTDATNALAVLMETGNPAMDYPRGPTNEKLIVEGKDEFYSIAASKGLLYVPYPEKGLPLQHRVARQLAGADVLIRVFSEIAEDGQTILVQGIPSYEDIETLGIGHFVLEP
jgi:hypothetical protein